MSAVAGPRAPARALGAVGLALVSPLFWPFFWPLVLASTWAITWATAVAAPEVVDSPAAAGTMPLDPVARGLAIARDGDKSMLVFDSPRDIKGTALLTWSHALDPDEQWMYLPALKRVKRIASANKSGPFVGSEFAYEDFSSQEVEKYAYRWLRDEPLDGRETHVIERVPAYSDSGYARQIVWLATDILKPLKVEYYDRRDALLKTLGVSEYRRHLDRYWRAQRLEMHNHQSGKGTVLAWSDFRFRTGLGPGDFERSRLKRQR